jgi:hypothetical protein
MLGVSFRNAGNVLISAPISLRVRYTRGCRATVATSFDLSKWRLGTDRTVDGVISISASAPATRTIGKAAKACMGRFNTRTSKNQYT